MMTHETMLIEETIETQNGRGRVTVSVALGAGGTVMLAFSGRDSPWITFEYTDAADALAIGRALVRVARAAGASVGTEAG